MPEFHKDGQVLLTEEEREALVVPRLRIRRHPDQPAGLAALETRAMWAVTPDMVPVERSLLRSLIRYVRRLERSIGEGGF